MCVLYINIHIPQYTYNDVYKPFPTVYPEKDNKGFQN